MSTFPTSGVRLMQLLVVADYDRALAFYRDVLGATVAREMPGTLFRDPDGHLIEISQGDEYAPNRQGDASH